MNGNLREVDNLVMAKPLYLMGGGVFLIVFTWVIAGWNWCLGPVALIGLGMIGYGAYRILQNQQGKTAAPRQSVSITPEDAVWYRLIISNLSRQPTSSIQFYTQAVHAFMSTHAGSDQNAVVEAILGKLTDLTRWGMVQIIQEEGTNYSIALTPQGEQFLSQLG